MPIDYYYCQLRLEKPVCRFSCDCKDSVTDPSAESMQLLNAQPERGHVHISYWKVSGASQESRKNRKALGRQGMLWNTDFWKSHASCMLELTAAMIPCTGSTEDLSVVNRVGLMGHPTPPPRSQPSQNIYTQLKVGGEEEKTFSLVLWLLFKVPTLLSATLAKCIQSEK